MREKQCEMREKPESAKRQKMRGGESGSRSPPGVQRHSFMYFAISLQWGMKFLCREVVIP